MHLVDQTVRFSRFLLINTKKDSFWYLKQDIWRKCDSDLSTSGILTPYLHSCFVYFEKQKIVKKKENVPHFSIFIAQKITHIFFSGESGNIHLFHISVAFLSYLYLCLELEWTNYTQIPILVIFFLSFSFKFDFGVENLTAANTISCSKLFFTHFLKGSISINYFLRIC